MKKSIEKKVKQYSALASSVLAFTSLANAQVAYHDVNPDRVLQSIFPADTMHVDLNNDGVVDFYFFGIDFPGGGGRLDGIIPFGYSGSKNAVAGSAGIYSTYYGATGLQAFPSALSAGNVIDQNLVWYSFEQMKIPGGIMQTYFLPAMNSLINGSYYGNWQDGTEHYAPLKLVSGTDANYGWARCVVDIAAQNITIKDWAVQMIPNTSIQAGEGMPIGISELDAADQFSIYMYDGIANICINSGELEGTVTVTNIFGQGVVSKSISERNFQINLNQFSKGTYLITVQRGNEVLTRKVSIE